MEFTVPIIILSSISLILGILLVLADKFLADYGECKLIINGEKEFTVRGGSTILSYLSANKIFIPSACGGKSTCGYCKIEVLDGGGPILPTERPFMTREDKDIGIRLACQVKVKNDIEIHMPDFLETVKKIVKNKLYDPKLRWSFNIVNQSRSIHKDITTGKKIDTEEKMRINDLIEGCKDTAGSLVPVLQNINRTYNYLSEHALRYVSEELEIPLSVVYRIGTFYNAFSLRPRGKHIITVCLGTACQVKGAEGIISSFENELGIESGNTTDDMLFTLETVRCLGCCGLAPVVKVGDDIHGIMSKKKVPELIKMYKMREANLVNL